MVIWRSVPFRIGSYKSKTTKLNAVNKIMFWLIFDQLPLDKPLRGEEAGALLDTKITIYGWKPSRLATIVWQHREAIARALSPQTNGNTLE